LFVKAKYKEMVLYNKLKKIKLFKFT